MRMQDKATSCTTPIVEKCIEFPLTASALCVSETDKTGTPIEFAIAWETGSPKHAIFSRPVKYRNLLTIQVLPPPVLNVGTRPEFADQHRRDSESPR